MGEIIRVKKWEDFKKLAIAHHPSSIIYTVQRSPLSKPPIGLRLMFPRGETQYVFIDFAAGSKLKQTEIPVVKHPNGEEYVRDEDVKQFIIKELGRNDLLVICPVWRLEFY